MNNKQIFLRVEGTNNFGINPNFEDNHITQIDRDLDTVDATDDSAELETPDAPTNSSSENPFQSAKSSEKVTTSPKTGKVPSKNALGGYEPITIVKDNSEIVDKTPENSELNDPSKIKNDDPKTQEDEHPHQIQSGDVEASGEVKDIEVAPEIEVDANSMDTSDDGQPEPLGGSNEPAEVEVELNEGSKFKIIESGKIVTVVSKSNVVTTSAGTPTNVKGAYRPVNWLNEVAIKYEDGSVGVISKTGLASIGESIKKECKECGCGVKECNGNCKKSEAKADKIKKLKALSEAYAKKPFLTMKEVMLLNEAKKILSNVK